MMTDTTAGPAIEARGLSKSYGAVKALQDVDLEVGRGELFGIIGPDGAGKTTLIRILMTLLLADAGSARVLGQDVVLNYKTLRKQLGYMPGRFSLYEDLTVEENLSLFASIFGTSIEANYDLVRDIYSQIEPFKKRRAGKLSGGMKQKLALSCAMIHRPELIMLDEPTTGVDPVSRVDFWNMLKSLKASGVTILVSTTYMDEANLCDRVALMQEGRILGIDTPSGLVAGYGRGLYSVRSSDKHHLIDDIRDWPGTRTAFLFGESVHITIRREPPSLADMRSFLQCRGHTDPDITAIEPGVEDCFMELLAVRDTHAS